MKALGFPPRMICADCWRPLEISDQTNLEPSPSARRAWDCIIRYEDDLMAAIAGKVPDQFRYNFTSSVQLVAQTRDAFTLALYQKETGPQEIEPLGFLHWQPTPRQLPPPFDGDIVLFLLSTIRLPLRRNLLALAAALFAPDCRDCLFPNGPESLVEALMHHCDTDLLDVFLRDPKRWSPTFRKQFQAVRDDRQIRETASRIRHLEATLEQRNKFCSLNPEICQAVL